MKTLQTNSIYLETLEQDQVVEITNKLKPKFIVGHDEITSKLLKETNESLFNRIVPNH